VGALVIKNPSWCKNPDVCFSPSCLIDLKAYNDAFPFLTDANVGFSWCDNILFDYTSWVSLPAPNSTINICIKDTVKCLGLIYNLKKAALQVSLVEKNLQSLTQRWKLNGEKWVNFFWGPANLCVQEDGVFGLFLKPCDPANVRQKFVFV